MSNIYLKLDLKHGLLGGVGGGITLNEMDLVGNGNIEEEACKISIPYVLKTYIRGDAKQSAEEIATCQVE